MPDTVSSRPFLATVASAPTPVANILAPNVILKVVQPAEEETRRDMYPATSVTPDKCACEEELTLSSGRDGMVNCWCERRTM